MIAGAVCSRWAGRHGSGAARGRRAAAARSAASSADLKLTLNTYPHARLNQGGDYQSTEVGRTAGETYLRGKSRSENTVEAGKTFDTALIHIKFGRVFARCDRRATDYMYPYKL